MDTMKHIAKRTIMSFLSKIAFLAIVAVVLVGAYLYMDYALQETVKNAANFKIGNQ